MNDLEIQAVVRGNPQAVRTFIRDFAPVFLSVIRRRVLGPWREYEEDLLQEILAGIFAHNARVLKAWDAQKGRSLKTFLCVFVEQRTLDWLRRRQRHAREEPTDSEALMRKVDSGQGVEPQATPDWLEPLMSRFRAEFSQEDQRLVELSYVEDLSVREIAAVLNLTEDTVYQRRHRLKVRLLKLKTELSEEPGPERKSAVRKGAK